jgi:multimeric flavodoxin WrbA
VKVIRKVDEMAEAVLGLTSLEAGSSLGPGTASPVRVIGLAGSPRRNGNTEALLDRFLAGAAGGGAQVEKVVLARLKVRGCVACDECHETGACAIRDDFQIVFDKLLTADVIALAAPLYMWNVPAQAKAVIDRSECQWARRFVLGAPLAGMPAGSRQRRGVFISTAGQVDANFQGAIMTVEEFFDVREAQYWGEILCSGIDPKAAIADHPARLDEAFELGSKVVTKSRVS